MRVFFTKKKCKDVTGVAQLKLITKMEIVDDS